MGGEKELRESMFPALCASSRDPGPAPVITDAGPTGLSWINALCISIKDHILRQSAPAYCLGSPIGLVLMPRQFLPDELRTPLSGAVLNGCKQ